jgi:hypothetical protein
MMSRVPSRELRDSFTVRAKAPFGPFELPHVRGASMQTYSAASKTDERGAMSMQDLRELSS